MSLPRFYLPTLSRHSEEAKLPVEEAQHLTRVLRLQPGNNVQLFDGRGHEREATIKHATGKKVTVSLGKSVCETKESTITINLGIALLAGRKFDTVVRDATMLGASVITPLITLRSRGFKIRKDSNRLTERWHDIAVASTKQCGRSYLPVISPPFQFSQYLETQSIHTEQKLLLVEPSRHTPEHRFTPLQELAATTRPQTASIAIGPEGGWTDEEIRLAETGGYVPVTLGMNTLRAEAVPTIALSVFRFMWSDL